MTRKEILQKATECVCGQREQDYGTPEDNFRKIADLWNAYLGDKYVDATDVAMMMALLKVARIKSGTATEDSFVDLAGYAACGGEIKTTVKGPYSDIAEKCKLVYQAPFDWNKGECKEPELFVGDVRRLSGYSFPGHSDDEIFIDGSMKEEKEVDINEGE